MTDSKQLLTKLFLKNSESYGDVLVPIYVISYIWHTVTAKSLCNIQQILSNTANKHKPFQDILNQLKQ